LDFSYQGSDIPGENKLKVAFQSLFSYLTTELRNHHNQYLRLLILDTLALKYRLDDLNALESCNFFNLLNDLQSENSFVTFTQQLESLSASRYAIVCMFFILNEGD
jgi:hypothetical protein